MHTRALTPLRATLRLAASLVVALVAFFALTGDAAAYPWMIRHEYTTCATCHADPSGGGLMTEYGRAQSEVLLRTRYGEVPEDEDPTKLGGFMLGVVKTPEWLALQADVRSLLLAVKPPGTGFQGRRILMQADAAAGLKIDWFRASGSLGYLHEGGLAASVTRGTEDRLVSRQHWLGAVFGKDDEFLVRAGRMNLPFGLRMIEHTSYVRASTRTDINAAQQHGVALSWNVEGWRAEGMAILGNYQIRPDALRERGASAYVERAFASNLAVGASALLTHQSYDPTVAAAAFRHAYGGFARWSPAKPVVVMGEADLLVRSPKAAPIDLGTTALLQVDVEPTQGVHLAGTGELLTNAIGDEGLSAGGWFSAFWFFLPHLDVRGDVIYRSVPNATDRDGVVSFLAQLHGFL